MIEPMDRAEAADTRERALTRDLSTKIIRILELEKALSEKEASLLEKEESLLETEHQLARATASFKTVLALKNKTIENLRKELNEARGHDFTMDSLMKEIKKELECLGENAVKKTNPSLNITTSMNDSVVIRAVFTGVSKIREESVYSKTTISSHCKWAIQARRSATHLELYLVATALDGLTSFNRRAYVKFRLLSHDDCTVLHESCFSRMQEFNAKHPSWGKDSFIAVEDLMNPVKKFVRDDSIVVEVWFKEIDVVE